MGIAVSYCTEIADSTKVDCGKRCTVDQEELKVPRCFSPPPVGPGLNGSCFFRNSLAKPEIPLSSGKKKNTPYSMQKPLSWSQAMRSIPERDDMMTPFQSASKTRSRINTALASPN